MKKYIMLVLLVAFFLPSQAFAAVYTFDFRTYGSYAMDPNGEHTVLIAANPEYALAIGNPTFSSYFEDGVGYVLREMALMVNAPASSLQRVEFVFHWWFDGQMEYRVGQKATQLIHSKWRSSLDHMTIVEAEPGYYLDGGFFLGATSNVPLVLSEVTIYTDDSPATTPIPGAVWMLGTGLVGLAGAHRRFFS